VAARAAAIEDQKVVAKILAHLDVQSVRRCASMRPPGRSPLQMALFDQEE